ncbi:membrane-spanning 4-domains subfamily A member 15-like [Xenentodon cancila]
MFPHLCQTLKSSRCRLALQSSVAASLGSIQIMVGLLNIGLGPGRTSTRPGDFASVGAAYWLGAVFIVTGVMTILAGRFPSSCLLGFTVFMNIAGTIFAVTGVVLYVIDLGDASLLWICQRGSSSTGHYDDGCRNVALFAQNLLTSMDHTLIALAVLLLFVSVCSAVVGIRFLTGDMKKQEVVRC